jgi:acyl-CoA synthetase (AMP-forming)/AMP-acid ligase II/aryl carrier-like protein
LTHRNLCTSAGSIARTLELCANDRVLNVMPLFHIHGLVAATLAPISVGSSVVCTPGFLAPKFFEWLDQFQPTWYSAVPTMHQAILSRAATEPRTTGRAPLRFIRSSSAALPPQVMQELERTFGVPVIEAYGMTEASHQMASNPLPPRVRRAGSVGLAAGPQISIMDTAGNHLPAGDRGEIVIRGANVTSGYESNPKANAEAFTDGWFRTGDQGYLDCRGYLYITGRLKEQINRGGEKISPREIDEVLLDHPGIAQAVTFAMPHPTLGEEVAAAVVPRTKGELTEKQIQQFVGERMSHFKVPRRVVILDEIPKGPTGKIQRIGLAEKLGLTASTIATAPRAPFVAPQSPIEIELAALWEQVLNVRPIGVNDDFLQLGGDSILAMQLMARVHQAFGVELQIIVLFESPTVANLALVIMAMQMAALDPEFSLLDGSSDAADDRTPGAK